MAVVVLLAVVVVSYRQVVRAYPSGGGSYEVASRNLGPSAGLVVAAALLVDYVMTVAVSVAAGVDNIISAVPDAQPVPGPDQRGVRRAADGDEPARRARVRARPSPSPPTCSSVGVLVMVGVGLVRTVFGHAPVAESAGVRDRAAEHGRADRAGAGCCWRCGRSPPAARR